MMKHTYFAVAACFAMAVSAATASSAVGTVQNGLIVAEADTGNGAGFQLYSVDPRHPENPPVQITHLPKNPNNIQGMGPAFSPDGNRLAFIYEMPNAPGFDAYVIDVTGHHLDRLTTDYGAVSVAWTPDGSRILVGDVATNTGRAQLSTIPADGSGGQTPLTNDAFDNVSGRYTPDGSRIIFASSREGISDAAWSMNPDGSDKRRLTDVARVFCPTGISPDGKKVLLVPFCNNADFKTQNIWVMDADGRNVKQLTNPGPHIVDLPGVYSPDGKKIAFSSNRGHPNGLFALWVMNADGTDAKMLLKSPAAFPTWAAAK